MDATIRFFVLVVLSTVVSSCGFVYAQQNDIPTVHPTSFSPTPKPLITATFTPSVTPTTPTATPSQAPIPACIAKTQPPNGWDCLNESYGFIVHLPSTAEMAGTAGPKSDVADIWLENSPSNPRVERMLSISLGKIAESCISSDAETMHIGEQNFIVNHGFEPSGVVYEWRSYILTKESKSVCFWFTVGFQTWEQNDPLFPPEKDQGLDEVKAILATFRWLDN